MTITATKKKLTKGRQKIEIKKIDKKSALQVTCTKRRTGIFQKASELCILCGAEIAIITFSPGNKVFTFGNPSTDYIVNMFQNNIMNPSDRASIKNEAYWSTLTRKEEYHDAVKKFELEKQKVQREARNEAAGFWWDAPAEEMDLEELEVFKDSLHELRSNVCGRIAQLNMSSQGNDAANMSSQGAETCVDPEVPSFSLANSEMLMSQYNFNGMA